MFRDRTDAGHKLGEALTEFRGQHPLILGIPRGGVRIAREVAETLNTTFSVIIVRKLPFPENPEAGFGAIAEDGSLYIVPGMDNSLPASVVDRTTSRQEAEVTRRIRMLRGGRPLPDLKGRHVILVDDGIAMGSTTQAAVLCCRRQEAGRVTVAAPVASPDAVRALEETADAVVCLEMPSFFRAVAEFYETWYDVPDREAVELLDDARKAGRLADEKAAQRDPGPGKDIARRTGGSDAACIRRS